MKSPSENLILNAALDYAFQGWPVFPVHSVTGGKCSCGKSNCEHPGKHPRTKHGLHDATIDPQQIRKWWHKWPDANLAARTGAESGFWVLDIDGAEGEELLAKLIAKHGELPQTAESRTGKGRHLYLRHPGDGKIKSRSNILGLGSQIDVKGDGGYITLPPSNHYSGKTYRWEPLASPKELPPADAPAWLLILARKKNRTASGKTKTELGSVLNGVPAGQRDDALFKYACSLHSRKLSRQEVEKLVLDAAANCVPPFPTDEALRKVQQAFKYPDSENTQAEKPGSLRLTDWGMAQRIAAKFGDCIRYCEDLGGKSGWMRHDGKKWVADKVASIQAYAKKTVAALHEQAAAEPDDDKRQAITKFAIKCESAGKIGAMTKLLESEEGIPVTDEVFDKKPWLLNVSNGTLDLRTGELRPHDPNDLITKMAPVEYDPAAECPLWEHHIDQVMEGNEESKAYLQRVLGSALSGVIKEQAWFFLLGTGSNGKTTIINVLLSLLGDYAWLAPSNMFTERKNDAPTNDLARMRGARFVCSDEPKGRQFDAELIKSLAGKTGVTARFLHKEFITFRPECKIFLAANTRPAVKDPTDGFWRKLQLIPFDHKFQGADKDEEIEDKLLAEGPGILAWLVRGCLAWHEQGLTPPEMVNDAVGEYRSDSDYLAAFIEECCVIDLAASVPVAKLYHAYSQYCQSTANQHPLKNHGFNENLRSRQGISRGLTGPSDHRVKVWVGIGLRSERGEENVTQIDFVRTPSAQAEDPETLPSGEPKCTTCKENTAGYCPTAGQRVRTIRKCPMRSM